MTSVVDTNVLLYAVDTDSPFHQRAYDWLSSQLVGLGQVGFSWVALLGFARIATNPRIMTNPASVADTFDVIDNWLGQPGANLLNPTPGHSSIVRQLLDETGTAANLVNDAHLAALAIQHNASVCSFDRDFSRFADVQLIVP